MSGCRAGAEHDVAIVGVSVLNPASGLIEHDRTVYIDGATISAIRPQRRGDRDAARSTIDGTGRIAMPGLWDMHVHLGNSEDAVRYGEFPLFLAQGVLYIRDMWPAAIPRTRRRPSPVLDCARAKRHWRKTQSSDPRSWPRDSS